MAMVGRNDYITTGIAYLKRYMQQRTDTSTQSSHKWRLISEVVAAVSHSHAKQQVVVSSRGSSASPKTCPPQRRFCVASCPPPRRPKSTHRTSKTPHSTDYSYRCFYTELTHRPFHRSQSSGHRRSHRLRVRLPGHGPPDRSARRRRRGQRNTRRAGQSAGDSRGVRFGSRSCGKDDDFRAESGGVWHGERRVQEGVQQQFSGTFNGAGGQVAAECGRRDRGGCADRRREDGVILTWRAQLRRIEIYIHICMDLTEGVRNMVWHLKGR